MTFLNPLGFLLAAVAPVIVLLYLLKHRRTVAPVSTLLFWRRAVQRHRRRALLHRVRSPLSLLLQLLILALLVLAAARPEWRSLAGLGASTAIVIDRGRTMQTIGPDGRSRFEEARQIARSHLRRASPLHPVALVAFDSEPRVLAPFTDDERLLLRELEAIRPTDIPSHTPAALELASDMLAGRGGTRRIVLLTDAPRPATHEIDARVAHERVGTPAENVAITHLSSRPLAASPDTSQILIGLRNEGAAPRSGNVELTLDGRLFDVRPFNLRPGESTTEILAAAPAASEPAAPGWLVARIDAPDALENDNRAYALLAPPPRRSVLLVGRGDFYLERLLAVDGQTDLRRVRPEAFREEMAARHDVVIFDRTLPAGADLAAMQRGNFLLLGVAPFAGPPAESLDSPAITDVDPSSPILRFTRLQRVGIGRAVALDPTPPTRGGWSFQIDARAGPHPLILRGRRPARGAEQRAVVCAFAPAETDLPLRVAFPLLVGNTLQWLQGDTRWSPTHWRVGESRQLAGGQRVWTRPFREAPPPTAPAPENEIERASFRPVTTGFYRLDERDARRWIAVNAEAPHQGASPAAAPVADAARDPIPRPNAFLLARPPWFTLALAALCLLLAEWWLYQRRKTE